MPKMKSHSGTKKRFRRTGTGKLMRAKAFKSHILTKKTTKRKRNFRQEGEIAAAERRCRLLQALLIPDGDAGEQLAALGQGVLRQVHQGIPVINHFVDCHPVTPQWSPWCPRRCFPTRNRGWPPPSPG